MQTDSGILRWLKVPFLYNLFQEAAGANAVRRSLVRNHVRPKVGDKLIDIGCGTAQILQCLPEVEYIGFTIEDRFVVGYGLDYGEKYRSLAHIAELDGE